MAAATAVRRVEISERLHSHIWTSIEAGRPLYFEGLSERAASAIARAIRLCGASPSVQRHRNNAWLVCSDSIERTA